MKLTLIKEWIEACDRLGKAYENREEISCPLCAVAKYEPDDRKLKGCCCPWTIFSGVRKHCLGYKKVSYERRIKRLNGWKRRLKKML